MTQAIRIIIGLVVVVFGSNVASFAGNDAQSYKYGGKELYRMEGMNLYDFHARSQSATTLTFTTPDSKLEDYPGISPYAYCAGNPIMLIDPSGEKPSKAEAALMALHVYGGDDASDIAKKLADSKWMVSTFKSAINDKSNNGLNAILYQRDKGDGTIEYAYVYAGTASITDLVEDVKQLVGASSQYSEAVENARILSDELGDSELTFVGHSLGGGEAAAASMATGRDATTFNPAALTKGTVNSLNLNMSSNITNYITIGKPVMSIGQRTYYVGGDPINNMQSKFGLIPVGNIIYVPTNSISLTHGIRNFIPK